MTLDHDLRSISELPHRAAHRRPPEFETKDSGQRQEYPTGMRRDTRDGKPRFDLLILRDLPYEAQPLTRLAALMARGAGKYGERNFEKASTEEELNRFRESAFRHMMQWLAGETDEDHMAAVMFNLAAAEMVRYKSPYLERAAPSRPGSLDDRAR
jgi:dATP/dGTP diphosphohydrolase